MLKKPLILILLTVNLVFAKNVDVNLVINNMAKVITSNLQEIAILKKEIKQLQLKQNQLLKEKQKNSCLESDSVLTARVVVETTHTREKAYYKSPIVEKLFRGDIVKLVSKIDKYGWYKTISGNYIGGYVLEIMDNKND